MKTKYEVWDGDFVCVLRTDDLDAALAAVQFCDPGEVISDGRLIARFDNYDGLVLL